MILLKQTLKIHNNFKVLGIIQAEEPIYELIQVTQVRSTLGLWLLPPLLLLLLLLLGPSRLRISLSTSQSVVVGLRTNRLWWQSCGCCWLEKIWTQFPSFEFSLPPLGPLDPNLPCSQYTAGVTAALPFLLVFSLTFSPLSLGGWVGFQALRGLGLGFVPGKTDHLKLIVFPPCLCQC